VVRSRSSGDRDWDGCFSFVATLDEKAGWAPRSRCGGGSGLATWLRLGRSGASGADVAVLGFKAGRVWAEFIFSFIAGSAKSDLHCIVVRKLFPSMKIDGTYNIRTIFFHPKECTFIQTKAIW